ncbi:MAG: hydantoinase/oxoprolinase family protein, partial [Pseudomonadota bacterium]
ADSAEAVSRMVVDTLTRRSAELALEAALAEDGFEADGLASSPLGAAALDGRRGFAAPALALTAPLIGLGASARNYYPAVAKAIGVEASIPDHADVANAIGAVAGRVDARVTATILSPDGESFELMAGGAPQPFATLEAAKAHAEDWAARDALAKAEAAGADAPTVDLVWTEARAKIEARDVLVEAVLTARATGRPRFR